MQARWTGLAAMAVAALGLGATPGLGRPSGRNAPNLAACPKAKSNYGAEIQRRKAIPVPRVWSGVVRSDLWRFAVSTFGGRTLCIDTGGIEDIEEPELSADGRFLRYRWYGYETGGYTVVDRSGKGAEFDTGDKPVPSPSGQLAAVVQYSEAGFGSLEGFGVWHVGKPPMRELARLSFPEGLTDWRMDGWRGENCVLLSAMRFEDMPVDEGGRPKGHRQAYAAVAAKGKWRIVAGGKAACPRA